VIIDHFCHQFHQLGVDAANKLMRVAFLCVWVLPPTKARGDGG